MAEEYADVILIQFYRNYGKAAALAEGFNHSTGDYIVTMDADLQDDPLEINSLYEKLNEGYDLVSGWKKVRYDPLNKRLPSKLFNFDCGPSADLLNAIFEFRQQDLFWKSSIKIDT